jgi:signal transduction histidine kinase
VQRTVGLALLVILWTTQLAAQQEQRRVLIVFGHNATAPGAVAFNRNLQSHFIEKQGINVEFYSELLDFDRFPDRGRWPMLARAIAAKHGKNPPAAIVTEGSAGLQFAVDHLRASFPNTPIIYAITFDPIIDYSTLPPNVTGRRQKTGFAETLLLAKRLQPDAEHVALIGGASMLDSAMFNAAVSELRPLLGGMTLLPMQDWTYPTLLQSLRRLPPRTIALLSSFRRDQRGYEFSSGDLIASMTHVSQAPIYGVARNWVGNGVVGGAVLDFDAEGRATARMLEGVLRDPNAPLPPHENAPNPLVADARQLARWNLPMEALPVGVEVINREPSAWQQHRAVIIAVIGIVVAQLGLIVLLLLERGRRRRAQMVAEESRGQVTHIARVATVGQITAAVSHELRQPLTAIHASAQAGELILSQPEPDVGEAREMFQHIVSADERAVELIDHIRGLLRHEQPQRSVVDLNDICQRCVQLLQLEVRARDARLESSFDQRLSKVRGDAVQLEQVVINLIMNGLDAATAANQERVITLGTREGVTEVEMTVRNSGSSLTPEAQANLFRAFYSTKPHGLGMGLAIVRMIIERHQGVVRGRNHPDGGVVFSVILPKA